MSDFMEELCYQVLELDDACAQASRQASKRAEPMYQRLMELAGEEGDAIWEAAVLTGCAETPPAFWGGLRFGLNLLAAVLAQ